MFTTNKRAQTDDHHFGSGKKFRSEREIFDCHYGPLSLRCCPIRPFSSMWDCGALSPPWASPIGGFGCPLSKVTDIGTNRKTVCYFLLVI